MSATRAIRPDLDFDDVKTGFAVGKAAALSEWAFRKEVRDFAAVVNRLRVLKWQKANPEKRRAIANRYAAKPDVVQRSLAAARKRRADLRRAEGQVFTCQLEHCGAQFCRVPGVRGMGMHPRFCTPGHYATWYNREHRKADPEKQRTCKACGDKGHNRRGCKKRAA